jgi:hypothetical protein
MRRTLARGRLTAAALLATALVAVAVASATAAATPPISGISPKQCATQTDGFYCWFHSKSFNIECELRVSKSSSKSYAYCQTVHPPRSATLSTKGTYKVCNGGSCIGNGPENSRTFAAGTSLRVGPFRCASKISAITCTIASGRGFSIGKRLTAVS